MNRQRRVKALGGSGGGVSYAYLPLTITFDGELSDPTPDFDFIAPLGSVALGDTLRFQQATDTGFTANLTTVDTVITQTMIDNLAITPALGAIATDGTYYWRARMVRSAVAINDWSNTQSGVMDVPPVVTSASTASVAENATLSYTLTANQPSTWSIVAGGDGAKFEISGTTLRWASNGTKDFEAPDDTDTNNTYVVTVRATAVSDSQTGDKVITVTVTDVVESAQATLTGVYSSVWTGTGVGAGNITATGVAIGAAAADRLVVICGNNNFANTGLTAATIGGVAATIIEMQRQNGQTAWIIQANVPTGTTATVVTTWDGTGPNNGSFCAYTLYGLSSMTPQSHTGSAGNAPQSVSLAASAGCALIGCQCSIDFSATLMSATFSQTVTKDRDTTNCPEIGFHQSAVAANATYTIANTGPGNDNNIVAATWH